MCNICTVKCECSRLRICISSSLYLQAQCIQNMSTSLTLKLNPHDIMNRFCSELLLSMTMRLKPAHQYKGKHHISTKAPLCCTLPSALRLNMQHHNMLHQERIPPTTTPSLNLPTKLILNIYHSGFKWASPLQGFIPVRPLRSELHLAMRKGDSSALPVIHPSSPV